jgi:hypothetical protein
MFGLGDNIMQRPFVRAAYVRNEVVYLQTPWPELYADMPRLRFVRSATRLRTQAKNERASRVRWHLAPSGRRVQFAYGSAALATGASIQEVMEQRLPLGEQPFIWDLPTNGRAPRLDTGGRPIALIRPVTERSEWHNSARSPRPEYVNEIAARLMETHYVVAVADLEQGKEWLVGDMPVCDRAFVRGELSVVDLLELMRAADVTVGGVGWIVPAALAMGSRAFIVLGGNGGHNAPEMIVDRRADSSRLGFAMPERFCRCTEKLHDCEKVIADPLEQFERWAAAQGVSQCSSPSSPVTAPG